jgi:hypothetical protein
MRGQTAKLIRKVARQNIENTRVPAESQYTIRKHDNAIILTPCLRQTIKFIKKSYKNGEFTTQDLKLASVE